MGEESARPLLRVGYLVVREVGGGCDALDEVLLLVGAPRCKVRQLSPAHSNAHYAAHCMQGMLCLCICAGAREAMRLMSGGRHARHCCSARQQLADGHVSVLEVIGCVTIIYVCCMHSIFGDQEKDFYRTSRWLAHRSDLPTETPVPWK